MSTKDPRSMGDIDPRSVKPNTALLDSGQGSSEATQPIDKLHVLVGDMTDCICEGMSIAVKNGDCKGRDSWIRLLTKLVDFDDYANGIARKQLDTMLNEIEPPP